MVGVAQLVRAPGCGPGGRGFKSHLSPQEIILAPWCNWLTHRPFKAKSTGSTPVGVTKIKASLQMQRGFCVLKIIWVETQVVLSRTFLSALKGGVIVAVR